MPLEQILTYLPWAAVIGGALLLLWGQRNRLAGLVSRFRPTPQADPGLSPSERFERLYALRT